MKYIIEHLEPTLSTWCVLEYLHISDIVGKESLIFSNVKSEAERAKLKEIGSVDSASVKKMNLKRACVLDPNAEQMLTPEDANNFDFVIFGGILGDDPPQRRTEDMITSKVHYEARNLGQMQMSTDTAVLVANKILNGKKFEDIKFQDGLDIEVENEDGIEHTINLPYRYVLEDGKAVLAAGIIEYLAEKEEF